MDEILKQKIKEAFQHLSSYRNVSSASDFDALYTQLSREIGMAVITYTHAYVAEQMNKLVAANTVGQPAHINPPLP